MAYLLDANVFIQAENLRIGVGVKCMSPCEAFCLERARFVLGRFA
jgi:hypothetical protein